jgi:hypothetical protein
LDAIVRLGLKVQKRPFEFLKMKPTLALVSGKVDAACVPKPDHARLADKKKKFDWSRAPRLKEWSGPVGARMSGVAWRLSSQVLPFDVGHA